MKRLTLALPLLALPLMAASPALAQQETNSSTTFDAWVMSCTSRTDKDAKTIKGCEIRSTMIVRDQQTNQQGVAAVLSIGRLTTEKALRAVIQLPIAAQLDVPVKLAGPDGKAIAELTFVACQPQVCSAATTLTDAQTAGLRKLTDKLTILYRNQAGQDVKLDSAMTGFNQALDAVLKEK